MWFLEHETLFGGKRVWLRPGSQHLFGRTKPGAGDGSASKNVFIDNKNVSRKHMTIKVLDVSPADGTKVHKRSQIEVTDFSCRQGTTVDGERTLKSSKEADGTITEDTATLSGTEHTIRLSFSYPAFTLRWQDVVFTYASKEKKGASQLQASTRNEDLHAMDIKTSLEFLYGKTTHVVSQKRNLPEVLQALVSGAPIVTTDYLDAILRAATHSTDGEGNYVPSQLEEDFDTWWPQEKEYIPPAGQEPVPRPDQLLAPDPTRSEVFAGLTFIFLNEAQHTSLHQVVAGGGGKALLFDIRPGETTVAEYVDYVQSVAGKKKRGRPSNDGLPVVTIRIPTFPDELEEWATNFVTGVDQALNQRSILQNEFLDAIIMKDNSSLRRPPTAIALSSMQPSESTNDPPPGRVSSSESRAPSQAPEANSVSANEPAKAIPRKRPARRPVTSRFTGFDDYEPPAKSRKIEEAPVEDTPMEEAQAFQQSTQRSQQEHEPSMQSQVPPLATQTQRTTRSQPRPAVQASLDQMFPAMAEVKRRREATRGATVTPAASVQPDTQANQTQNAPKKEPESILARVKAKQAQREKQLEKDIDVQEETRKRMAEEEDKRRDEEEKLRAALEGVDITKIHVDIKVEGMKIRSRDDRVVARTQLQGQGQGWKPEWNGRKNFKAFRRRGTANREEREQSQKVIVGLKAAPSRKGFGDSMRMDEEVPVRTEADEMLMRRQRGMKKGRKNGDDERPVGFQRRIRRKPTETVIIEDSGSGEEDIPAASGSTVRNSGRTQRVAETQLEEDGESQINARKRSMGPLSIAAGQPPAKKSRTAGANEDSDNEEGGFRLKRKNRT